MEVKNEMLIQDIKTIKINVKGRIVLLFLTNGNTTLVLKIIIF